jgi:hypothetical protein
MYHKIYSPVSTLCEQVEREGEIVADKSYVGPLTNVFARTQRSLARGLKNNCIPLMVVLAGVNSGRVLSFDGWRAGRLVQSMQAASIGE